jgi:hypothetical protein
MRLKELRSRIDQLTSLSPEESSKMDKNIKALKGGQFLLAVLNSSFDVFTVDDVPQQRFV